MQQPYLTYNRDSIVPYFAHASRDDIKWTIHYLVNLLDRQEPKIENSKMTLEEAKEYLDSIKLEDHGVPSDFNGMRDEVNPKYL